MEQGANFDYKRYCENILAFMKSAPVNLFFKDTACKYRFVTRHCNMVYGDDNSILGKAAFPVTAIMSDCNYLKRVNDAYGHEADHTMYQNKHNER